jgi:hypothetical protein
MTAVAATHVDTVLEAVMPFTTAGSDRKFR